MYQIFIELLMYENDHYQPSKRVWKMVKRQGILKWILSDNPGARKLHHLFVLKMYKDFKFHAPASLEWDFFLYETRPDQPCIAV